MQKIIPLALALVCVGLGARAQTKNADVSRLPEALPSPITKGNWMLGADLYFVSHRFSNLDPANSSKESSSEFAPFVGYFIKNKWALGVISGYNKVKSEGPNVDEEISAISIGPAMRYYLPLSSKFMFFGEAYLPLGYQKRQSGGVQALPQKSIGISLSPGFVFFASNRFSFQTKFGEFSYKSQKQGDNRESFTTFSVLGNRLTLGLNIHFGKY